MTEVSGDGTQNADQRIMSQSLDRIYARLTELLRETFDDDSLVARPDLTAGEVSGWDSFGHLRLMFKVEQSFGVSFAASQISALKNVGELAELIATKAKP